jgi:amidohydrolase
MQQLLDRARAIAERIVSWRRDFHAHPELGYRETRTAGVVAAELARMGWTVRAGVARTGVVAELGSQEGPIVALRADMDALPMQEAPGLPYASTVDGVMHACGHDAHVAMLLGAAALLAELESEEGFAGTIRLLFQPSEENNYDDPDGLSGGPRMIAEGALEGVRAALGLHVMPDYPSGTIDVKDGPVMAAADFFSIDVMGRSAHAGVAPQEGVDAILAAAAVVQAANSIISRDLAPLDAGVLSICTIQGGTTPNAVADRVCLRGTVRSFDERTQARIHERLAQTLAAAEAYGARAELSMTHGHNVTINDPGVARIIRRVGASLAGEANVTSRPPTMGGEDFSAIAKRVPSAFVLLGVGPSEEGDGENDRALHTPGMRLDESALPLGAALYASAALELLRDLRSA